jgi:hypothetical protein
VQLIAMPARSLRLVVALLTATGASMLAPVGVRAADEAPAARETETVPAPEAVERIIREVASLRDYERLYWILHAAEQQVPPVRATLLSALDQHMQQLLQSEIETRVASAVSSVAQLGGRTLTEEGKGARQPAPANDAGGELKGSMRASWVPAQEYADVESRLQTWQPSADAGTRMQEARELTRLIIGVEGREEQQKLHRLLQQRSADTARRQIQAQAEAAALAAVGDSGPEDTEAQ